MRVGFMMYIFRIMRNGSEELGLFEYGVLDKIFEMQRLRLLSIRRG